MEKEPVYEFDNIMEVIEAAEAEETTPGAVEILKMRGLLIHKIRQYIRDNDLKQADAAEKFGVSQPRISALMNGRSDLFGLNSLIEMAVTAGIEYHFSFSPENKKAA